MSFHKIDSAIRRGMSCFLRLIKKNRPPCHHMSSPLTLDKLNTSSLSCRQVLTSFLLLRSQARVLTINLISFTERIQTTVRTSSLALVYVLNQWIFCQVIRLALPEVLHSSFRPNPNATSRATTLSWILLRVTTKCTSLQAQEVRWEAILFTLTART